MWLFKQDWKDFHSFGWSKVLWKKRLFPTWWEFFFLRFPGLIYDNWSISKSSRHQYGQILLSTQHCTKSRSQRKKCLPTWWENFFLRFPGLINDNWSISKSSRHQYGQILLSTQHCTKSRSQTEKMFTHLVGKFFSPLSWAH